MLGCKTYNNKQKYNIKHNEDLERNKTRNNN